MEKTIKNGVECIKIGNILIKTNDEKNTYTWEELLKSNFKFGNWRVPNLEELQYIYNNKDIIGNFEKEWYWSCSYSKSDGYPKLKNFLTGEIGTSFERNDKTKVRCIYSNI